MATDTSTASAAPAGSAAAHELLREAAQRFVRLSRLAREGFPTRTKALEPFLAQVRGLLAELKRPVPASEARRAALAAQLAEAQEALAHLDALMEAFSLRPAARSDERALSSQTRA